MNQRLKGKTAVITGSGSNIGRAVAMLFAAEGASVAVADINESAADETVRLIVETGGNAISLTTDVGNEVAVKTMVERTVNAYGRLDILHNNAAVRTYPRGKDPITEMDATTWTAEFRVNVIGAMLCCKYAVPQMIAAGGGVIINTSSVNSMVGDLNRPQYGAAKAALNNLTMSIACLYGQRGIRCNAIAPGNFPRSGPDANPFGDQQSPYILPDRHQLLRRRGRPEDVANLALFLASDDSSFITGRIIPCDGGLIGVQHFDFVAQRPLPGDGAAVIVPWS